MINKTHGKYDNKTNYIRQRLTVKENVRVECSYSWCKLSHQDAVFIENSVFIGQFSNMITHIVLERFMAYSIQFLAVV